MTNPAKLDEIEQVLRDRAALTPDEEAMLIAAAREAIALRENGPPMQRGTLGDGSPWMGTMRDVLNDYREAAEAEAHERRRAQQEAAAYRTLIEAHNARLAEECKRAGSRWCRDSAAPCNDCPRRRGIELPAQGGETGR